jgi:hypothetical protein
MRTGWLPALAGYLLLPSCSKDEHIHADTPDPRAARMQSIADSMRTEMDALIGFPVPGMHFHVQGPNGTSFSSTTPAVNEKAPANWPGLSQRCSSTA